MHRAREIDAFLDRLKLKLESIHTRDDLAEFVSMLHLGVRDEMFEEQDVEEYVSGLYGIINGLDGLAKNTGIPNPDPPDWKVFGRILLAAFYHS